MKYKQIGFTFSLLLLMLLIACAPATPTPVSCIQTGCVYPAVCEQSTGACVINNPSGSGPGALANTGPAQSGGLAVNGNPSGPIDLSATATTTPTAMPPTATPPGLKLPSGVSTFVDTNNIPSLQPVYKSFKECGQTQIYYPGGYKLIFNANIQHSKAYSYPAGFPPDGMGEGFFGPASTSFTVQECSLQGAINQCAVINETFGDCKPVIKQKNTGGSCPAGQTLQYNPLTGTYVCK